MRDVGVVLANSGSVGGGGGALVVSGCGGGALVVSGCGSGSALLGGYSACHCCTCGICSLFVSSRAILVLHRLRLRVRWLLNLHGFGWRCSWCLRLRSRIDRRSDRFWNFSNCSSLHLFVRPVGALHLEDAVSRRKSTSATQVAQHISSARSGSDVIPGYELCKEDNRQNR